MRTERRTKGTDILRRTLETEPRFAMDYCVRKDSTEMCYGIYGSDVVQRRRNVTM